MYNLAIPAFAFFAAPGDVRQSHTATAFFWVCRVVFAVMGKNAETRTQSQSPDVTDERL